jgi:hypothetical protein
VILLGIQLGDCISRFFIFFHISSLLFATGKNTEFSRAGRVFPSNHAVISRLWIPVEF